MTNQPRNSVGEHTSSSLFGRQGEVARLSAVVGALPRDGGPLVVRGAAGIGKSSLIAIAVDEAQDRGIPTTSTSGVQVEAHLAFAGLYQLVRPFLSRLDRLPIGQRNALAGAFGMSEATSGDPFLVALGTLELLASEARDHGLLVAVNDAHWLDDPSARVLSFVARRCASYRFALLIEICDGYPTPLNDLGLPELQLSPLDERSSRALLNASAPGLPELWSERVLTLAAGNPLALSELPAVIAAGRQDVGRFDEELPLNQRLEYAFGSRLAGLPRSTRTLAIVAAEDDEDHVAELLAAARLIDRTATVDSLQPAIDAGLLVIDRLRLHFVHPLMRSAVRAAATHGERLRAHDSLAEVLAGQPDRRAWHRAAGAVGLDESIAADLERVADSASMRGGAGASLAALERSAELTPDAHVRGLRRLRAAEIAIEVGELPRAANLVGDAERSGLHGADFGRASLVREALAPGKPGDPDRVSALTNLAADMQADGHLEIAARALETAATQSWWSDPGQSVRAAILHRAESLHTAKDDPRVLVDHGLRRPRGAQRDDR